MLVPVASPLDHDLFGQPVDQTDRLRQYLAAVLLANPDWWPWVISRWASRIKTQFSTVAEYIGSALDGLAEGVHQPWVIPTIEHTLTHAELSRLTEDIEQRLGKVGGGLKYSLDEMVELLAQVGSLMDGLPYTGIDWYSQQIDQKYLLRYHLQQLTTDGQQVLQRLSASPRLLWLAAKLMMSPRRASTSPAPYGDQPRDQLVLVRPSSGYVERATVTSGGTFPSTESSISISFELDDGTLSGVLSAPGATAAEMLTKSEPFEFTSNQSPHVTSNGATYDVSFVDANNYWYVYIDGTKFGCDIPSGTYTVSQIVAYFQGATNSDGDALTTVADVYSTKLDTDVYSITVLKINAGGSVIIGDGTTVNNAVGFVDWDSSEDDSNPRTGKGTLANNKLSLKVDGSEVTVYVSAGTYTAAELVTELDGNDFGVSVYDSVRVKISSLTYGGRSTLEIVETQMVMGLIAGSKAQGAPARIEDLQLAASLYYKDDLKVRPVQPTPAYHGQVNVIDSTTLELPSGSITDGIEPGMVVTILSGPQSRVVMVVDSIVSPSQFSVDSTLSNSGQTILVDVRDGRFRLVASNSHHKLEVTDGEPFFPTDTQSVVGYAQDDRWDVVQSKSALKWVRVGDVLDGIDGRPAITEISVDKQRITVDIIDDVVSVTDQHPTDVGSADWDALAAFDADHHLQQRMREYLNLVNTYRHRPGNDVRNQLIDLLTDWGQQVQSVIDACEDYIGSVRSLKEVESVVDRLKANGYDRAERAFLIDPSLIADLFPEQAESVHSWVSGNRVTDLAKEVVRPPDTFNADLVVSTSKIEPVEGDVDVDATQFVEGQDLFETDQGLPWES